MIGSDHCGRAVTLVCAITLGAGSVARADVVAYKCKPAISHYCQNIHIGCSGRSKRKATSFEVHIDGSRAFLRRGDTATPVRVSAQNGELVLRDPKTGNWVRILTDRSYAERLQALKPALMARGVCTVTR